MKQLSQVLVFIFFLALLSCSDQRSTESSTINSGIQESNNLKLKDSTSTISADSGAASLSADSGAASLKTKYPQDGTGIDKPDAAVAVEKDSTVVNKKDSALTKVERKSPLFATVPSELRNHVSTDDLPTTAAIGIKPYPQAFLIKQSQKTEYRGKTYVTLELASPDTPEKVLEYYQKWKDNWYYMGGDGVYTFKKEEDKYFRETNTLQILTFNEDLHAEISKLLNFKPQTLIRIYYEAK